MNPPPDLPHPVADPFDLVSLLPILLVLVFFVAIAGLIIWIVMRAILNEAKVLPKEVKLAPPRQEAMQRMRELEAAMGEMDARQMATEITEMIKRFLERHYGVDLKSHTTNEYYAALQEGSSGVPHELGQGLVDLFAYLDALKFQRPEDAEAHKQQILQQAVFIVEAEVEPVPQAQTHGANR